MDFVDLDKVLDEFEEEEKQALSIVPGQELQPSGYLEFLEKHQEQEWAALNPNKFSSLNEYTPDNRSAQESAGVSYDDPYDGFSTSKLGIITDNQLESPSCNGYERLTTGKKRNSQSAIVTSLTRVSTNGEDVGTVYSSTKSYERTVIANSSERKGTIAYQPIEVQTDALSPASEQELMSSPFPKSDIIVDGHGDTVVSGEQTCYNEGDQNHSPIYASMDTVDIMANNDTEKQQTTGPFRELVNENQIHHSESGSIEAGDSSLNSDIQFNSHSSAVNLCETGTRFTVSEQAVGFHDPNDEDLDDRDVNMYLCELDEGSVEDFSSSKTVSTTNHKPVQSQYPTTHTPDIQSDLNHVKDSKTRSLADELDEAESEVDHYSLSESLPKKFRSDVTSTSSSGTSAYQDPDLVADLGFPLQSENMPLHNGAKVADKLKYQNNMHHVDSSNENVSVGAFSDNNVSHLESKDRRAACNTLISGKMETEAFLGDKEKANYNSICEHLLRGRMEIEGILDDKEKANSNSICEHLLRGKMEIEGILDEVILNQQNEVNHDVHPKHLSEKVNLNSSHNQVDVLTAEGKSHETSQSVHHSNTVHSSISDIGHPVHSIGVGARPKDPSVIKKNRPNSLLGLSKVTLDLPAVVKPEVVDSMEDLSLCQPKVNTDGTFPDIGLQSQQFSNHRHTDGFDSDSPTVNETRQRMSFPAAGDQDTKPVIHDFSQPFNQSPVDYRNDQSIVAMEGFAHDTSQTAGNQKMKRPTSLNLPIRQDFSMGQTPEEDMEHEVSPGFANHPDTLENTHDGAIGINPDSPAEVGITMASHTSMLQNNIGLVAPFWIPDADAPMCMMCHTKFTMWKRRHHCRACGKVLCSGCCSQKAILLYMENKEARVCLECHNEINSASGAGISPRCPNPNNPNEYCSKVPPNQQVSNHANPPVVMVPTGVLRTSGSQKRSGEPKQVMFSDGIRPGGDLTELDGPEQARPTRRSARTTRRAAQQQQQQQTSPQVRKSKEDSLNRSHCLIPESGLPPLFVLQGDTGYVDTDETLNKIDYTADYKAEEGPLILYSVNKNLAVGVKIINLDCCVNRVCWCFVTRGMNTAGQSELIVLLELTEDEQASSSASPPRDIFLHIQIVYEEALKGSTIQDLGHSIFHQNFLGNRDHGGFLFLRPTFQCLNKLPLPEAPYLFGILLQKWEVPWAKVFPIRLMLRLGAEYRYYPCSLVSVRNRKPVFFEIGHTIINLLADFRNYQYMLTQIRGVTIHMENKKTVISFPRNRYNDVTKVVRNSNEHVMAVGSSFSLEADSHLVCIQNEDGNYQTQAINIQNKPRLVTGASFVVFNGALKSSSGLKAKSSIVEDGLMVQVLPEAMTSIKDALKNMTDHVIQCGPADSSVPEETVELRWVDNDRNFNIGVKSYIDETPLEGRESVSVKCPTDFLGDTLALRWTRVYFLHHEDSPSSHFDPMDLSRLTEDIAQACCTALVKHLDELKREGQVKLGLRVNLTADSVGYEIGSKGQSLPAAMINNLDTFLVPIVHQASEEGIIMELVFNIVE